MTNWLKGRRQESLAKRAAERSLWDLGEHDGGQGWRVPARGLGPRVLMSYPTALQSGNRHRCNGRFEPIAVAQIRKASQAREANGYNGHVCPDYSAPLRILSEPRERTQGNTPIQFWACATDQYVCAWVRAHVDARARASREVWSEEKSKRFS